MSQADKKRSSPKLNADVLRYGVAQAARVAWYSGQMGVVRRRSGSFNRPGEPKYQPQYPAGDEKAVRRAVLELFEDDRRNIAAGLYPAPENVRVRDIQRSVESAWRTFRDVADVNRRRLDRNGVEVRKAVDKDAYPAYYRQNFHYQTDGWFSDDSARLYDTQVEVLFGGTADVMRRAALAELAREIKGRGGAVGLRYLDVASGTGRFLREVMQAFPRLQASGLDLSPAYCAHARKILASWPGVDIIEGAAEAAPIEDASQDLVSCIYLFHELPPRVRVDVTHEIYRILRPGGLFVFADSLQFGDNADLDQRLEYFPEGFHEPFYKSYCQADLTDLFQSSGFRQEGQKLAFLTKVIALRKPE